MRWIERREKRLNGFRREDSHEQKVSLLRRGRPSQARLGLVSGYLGGPVVLQAVALSCTLVMLPVFM